MLPGVKASFYNADVGAETVAVYVTQEATARSVEELGSPGVSELMGCEVLIMNCCHTCLISVIYRITSAGPW
jgi:cbb3-type cytochrome oxidase cytochrome c subunit